MKKGDGNNALEDAASTIAINRNTGKSIRAVGVEVECTPHSKIQSYVGSSTTMWNMVHGRARVWKFVSTDDRACALASANRFTACFNNGQFVFQTRLRDRMQYRTDFRMNLDC